MSVKIVLTKVYDRTVLFYLKDGEAERLRVITDDIKTPLGTIVIGRVKKRMDSTNACFVDIGDGTDYYLRLPNDLNNLKFADGGQHSKVKCEDAVLVQVSSEQIKQKAPCVSFKLSVSSKYFALEEGRGVSFSSKIDKDIKRKILLPQNISTISGKYHIIVRTAVDDSIPREALENDLKGLYERFEGVLTKYRMLTVKSVLYKPESVFEMQLGEYLKYGADMLMTDLEDYAGAMREYAAREGVEFSFYEDRLLPLAKLYKLESVMDEVLGKRVYIKSGAFILIEQVETLTAIDVNSGHRITGEKEETVFSINKDAAVEIFRQLRLRNISGMILIDFINMEDPEHIRELSDMVGNLAREDDVFCKYVDTTGLGLVELTRKRIRMSIGEQWKRSN